MKVKSAKNTKTKKYIKLILNIVIRILCMALIMLGWFGLWWFLGEWTSGTLPM